MAPLLLSLSLLNFAHAEEPLPTSQTVDVAALIEAASADAMEASAPAAAVVPVAEPDLQQRLLGEAQTAEIPSLAAPMTTPWWTWPLALLGLAGVAGATVQARRRREGPHNDVLVLSRTALSRNASLAVIEVLDATGETRRMLIGVGGSNAPQMVADLTLPPQPAVVSAGDGASGGQGRRFEFADRQPKTSRESVPSPVAAKIKSVPPLETVTRKPADAEVSWMREASHAAEPSAPPAVDDEPVIPRRRGLAAYAQQEPAETERWNGQRAAAKTDLISQLLAERNEKPARPAPTRHSWAREEDPWQDPWARNFAAFLGQPSRQSK